MDELRKRISKTGAYISEMVWIGASPVEYNNKLLDLMREIEDDDLERFLPSAIDVPGWDSSLVSLSEMISNTGKFGLIAKVLVPICSDFTYNKNKSPKSWRSSRSYCRVQFVYGESLEEITSEIEFISEKLFEWFMTTDRKKTR